MSKRLAHANYIHFILYKKHVIMYIHKITKEVLMVNAKICGRCKVEKPADEFGKAASSKDGLNYYCKLCNRERTKEYREIISRINAIGQKV